MWRSTSITGGLLGLALLGGVACRTALPSSRTDHVRRYLRVTTARWDVDLYSTEAERMLRQINTEGIAVFRAQPGFVRYRLMRADRTTTVAVAEWESEALGKAGAERYREWMRHVGIMAHLTLETHAGEIVAGS